jgi:hypothetical protein
MVDSAGERAGGKELLVRCWLISAPSHLPHAASCHDLQLSLPPPMLLPKIALSVEPCLSRQVPALPLCRPPVFYNFHAHLLICDENHIQTCFDCCSVSL